jgi:hypothetical protein
MHMQSTSSAVSTPTCDRARHTAPQCPLSCTLTVRGRRAQLLRADRAVDAGRDRDGFCRTSEQWAVREVAAAHRSRRRAAHLHMRAMSTTCRPSTLVQRRHRTRSRAGRGSPSAPAAERMAHLCSISPSKHPSLSSPTGPVLAAQVGCTSHGSSRWPFETAVGKVHGHGHIECTNAVA